MSFGPDDNDDVNNDPTLDDEYADLESADRGDDPDANPAAEAEALAAAEAAKAAAPAEGEDEDDDDKGDVPYKRFKKTLDQSKDKDLRIAELEAEVEAAKPKEPAKEPSVADPREAEIDSLYEKVEDARLEGDTKLAAQLQRQLDKLNQTLVTEQARNMSFEAVSADKSANEFNSYLDRLEAAFPEVVKGTESYNVELVRDFNFAVDSFEKNGLSPIQALQKAQRILLGEFPTAEAAKPDKVVVDIASGKRKTAIANAVDAINKQPADAANKGLSKDEARITPSTLTDDEFDALPEAKKKQLRGDNG